MLEKREPVYLPKTSPRIGPWRLVLIIILAAIVVLDIVLTFRQLF